MATTPGLREAPYQKCIGLCPIIALPAFPSSQTLGRKEPFPVLSSSFSPQSETSSPNIPGHRPSIGGPTHMLKSQGSSSWQ